MSGNISYFSDTAFLWPVASYLDVPIIKITRVLRRCHIIWALLMPYPFSVILHIWIVVNYWGQDNCFCVNMVFLYKLFLNLYDFWSLVIKEVLIHKEWIRKHNEYWKFVERPFPYALVLIARYQLKWCCLAENNKQNLNQTNKPQNPNLYT